MKKMTSGFILSCVLYLGGALQLVYADCIYEGYSYPTGTRLGDLTCQPDGTWK